MYDLKTFQNIIISAGGNNSSRGLVKTTNPKNMIYDRVYLKLSS